MHLSAMKKVGNDRNVIVKCTSVADVLTGDKPHLFSSHQSFKLHLIFTIHIIYNSKLQMCLFFRSTGGGNITWNIFEQETVFSKSPNMITREKNPNYDNHVGHVGMQVGEWEASLRVDSGSVPSYLLIRVLQDRSDFSLQLLAEESDNFRAQATIQDN